MHRTGVPVCAGCRTDNRDRAYRAQYMLEYTLRQHGLTMADYDRTLAAQDGRCAICRRDTPLGRGRWHIDHDHVTGEFRGLLCNNCNRGIGFFGDDPEVIEAAARYIAAARRARR
jgi:Autographiviridae endonuclease VII